MVLLALMVSTIDMGSSCVRRFGEACASVARLRCVPRAATRYAAQGHVCGVKRTRQYGNSESIPVRANAGNAGTEHTRIHAEENSNLP